MSFPKNAANKLRKRQDENAFRTLSHARLPIDFSSNDYLGFANKKELFTRSLDFLQKNKHEFSGSGGSRLISGNHQLYQLAEEACCTFFEAETALIFNSGFDANAGLVSSLPGRNDLIFYDELVHASIRDGIQQSLAKAYKFEHNNIDHLKLLFQKHTGESVFVITETVFSMDGDVPDLQKLVSVCEENHAFLILDEAHAVGVMKSGKGLAGPSEISGSVFARIVTFGKAFGCNGAAVLGSEQLRDFLINFSRSFIYTTALPPINVAAIAASIQLFEENEHPIQELQRRIQYFRNAIKLHGIESQFGESQSAIQTMNISGNTAVKKAAAVVQEAGFDVKAILSPTVPAGQERLRICLHAFNSESEIQQLVSLLTEISFI